MSVGRALLGLLEQQPRYGYELKRLYDDRFGRSQPVKFGQVYSTLARLRRDAFVEIGGIEEGGGPDRKLYVLTNTGVSELERWLSEPEPPTRFIRNAMFTKVVLALASGRPAAQILDTQRAAHLGRMRELTARKRKGDVADDLSSDFELFHLEADLRWIDLAGQRIERLRSTVRDWEG